MEYRKTTVETVVSLSLKKDSPKIEISMKPREDSLYEPQDKGTYEKIKAYVLEKYGFKVSNLYIAQVKDKCGLDKRLNYNLSKKDDQHVPECPKEKEDAIMDAFRHFGLIEQCRIDYNCWIPTGYIAIWWDFYFSEDDGGMQGVYKLG